MGGFGQRPFGQTPFGDPSSAGEAVMQTIVAVLNDPAQNPPCPTSRSRTEAFGLNENVGFVLRAERETGMRQGAVSMRTRTVWLEIFVRGAAPADQAIDPYYVWAVQTLASSQALIGMLKNLDQSEIVWDVESSTDDMAVAGIKFDLLFPIYLADPTAPFGGH